MIRALAGTPERYDLVLDWPVRDGMLAFEEQLRADAVTAYYHAELVWAVLAAAGCAKSKKPPAKPAILKD